jgi:hypothetical protein
MPRRDQTETLSAATSHYGFRNREGRDVHESLRIKATVLLAPSAGLKAKISANSGMVRSAITDPEVASGAESRGSEKEQPKGRKREGREKRHTVTSVLMSPTLTQLRAHGPPNDRWQIGCQLTQFSHFVRLRATQS